MTGILHTAPAGESAAVEPGVSLEREGFAGLAEHRTKRSAVVRELHATGERGAVGGDDNFDAGGKGRGTAFDCGVFDDAAFAEDVGRVDQYHLGVEARSNAERQRHMRDVAVVLPGNDDFDGEHG